MIRVLFVSLIVVMTSATAPADEPVINAVLREYIDTLEKATNQLTAISDAASAKKVAEVLGPLDKQLAELDARWKRSGMTEKPGGAVLRHALEKINQFDTEWRRAMAVAGAKPALEKLLALKELATRTPSAKVERAKADVNALAAAVMSYELKVGQPPSKLDDLVMPPKGRPFVTADLLTDPWGKPYQYDPTGTRNKGGRPDVWSIGPPTKDPPSVIGNWATNDQDTRPKEKENVP